MKALNVVNDAPLIAQLAEQDDESALGRTTEGTGDATRSRAVRTLDTKTDARVERLCQPRGSSVRVVRAAFAFFRRSRTTNGLSDTSSPTTSSGWVGLSRFTSRSSRVRA